MKRTASAILALSLATMMATTVTAFVNFGPTDGVATLCVSHRSHPSKESSTQQFMSMGDDNDRGSSMFDMSSLNSRLKEVQQKEQTLPLVVLDAMLPRQVLELQVNNALLIELVRDCMARERPYIAMLGIARLASGQQIHLTRGVEVEILKDKLEFLPEGQGIKLALRATHRRFQIEEGSIKTVGGEDGYTEATVKFLDSAQEEEEEIQKARETSTDDNSEEYDRTSVARAIMKANELTMPNGNMPNNLSLVDRWIELAKEKERSPGQIDELLECIGEIPPSDQPSERAFWIGALINPLPAMGVALEIRPALLTAKKAEQRVEVALNGILRSIKYMDGSAGLLG
mmetsp:Transcript_19678/g.48954  ORF Transcript_19678/g.48954 Transcript_19678/m.48954 type:complete len:344 (-) Transcript_19678:238-1269(-)|eukprot:CAMPEP_0116097384 /NCGR_PEP_ID=MMETSP0327-20121206/10680_1 /TAXON_ID=44447 /ORGANISM="Pseudo-nitzschia delicatissima, Strain B596" /LENGTH=343 /DNA_ID=CAMNT_0003589139 /DNA_START=21 /DNA_END=1052 /DNA_ORIENTATION=+